MFKSQLKIGALLSYVVLALQNLVGLIYTPFMLRMMGKSEYGMYSIAASIVAYLAVLDLGFGNAIVRYTAKYRAEGKKEEQYSMFGMFFLIYCVIGLITLLAGGILYFNIEKVFEYSMSEMELYKTKIILILMAFNLAISFPFSLFGSIITAYEQFIFQKIVVIARIILNTMTMIVLLTLGYKAITMVVVATIFNILTLVCNFFYCKKSLKIKLIFGGFQWKFLREVSVFSLWIFTTVIMDRVYWSSGQFILGAYVGTAAVAVYAVAIQLQHIYMGCSLAISGVFLPKVTAMVVNGNDCRAVSDLFVKVGRVQYCLIGLILFGFFLFGRSFITLWAGLGYDDAYIIAMIFFVPFTIDLIQNIGIVILQARNQMKFRSLLGLFAAIISFVLQLLLAKYYGGIGCALGVAIVLFLAQGLIMNVYYRMKQGIDISFFWREILKMSIVPCIVTIVAYFVIERLTLNSWLSLGLGIMAYLAVYLPLFFIFSMNAYEKKLILNAFSKVFNRYA